MLLSRRVTRVPELGVALETHAVLHRRYRVHAVRNHGVTIDDRLVLRAFPRKGHLGRSMLTVVLRGAASLAFRSELRHLLPGDVVVLPCKTEVAMRQTENYESLVFEWDSSWLGREAAAFECGRLAPATLAEAVGTARALTLCVSTLELATTIRNALAALAAEGLPLTPLTEHELTQEIDPATARLSAELDRLMSSPGDLPMVVDLERTLGFSPRHLSRRVADFHRRFGFNAEGWCDARTRRRLMIGAALMTVPTATTEAVGRRVGYGSATAFCRAMADVGLPQPGQIAREVRALA